jgi:4-carboxymuconolactone decarboxylase
VKSSILRSESTPMKALFSAVTTLLLAASPLAQAASAPPPRATTPDDARAVSPALHDYAQNRLAGEVWKRPGLAARNRSLITVAALVARSQTAEMAFHMHLALDNGVKASEISETITHLAFYAGWGQAMAAVPVAREVFIQRRVKAEDLPPVGGPRLPLNEAAEAQRAAAVQSSVGTVSPGVVQYTGDVLFKDLWLRPALAPRDRSLVVVTTLIANGQVAQLPFHLNRAMDNGLTQAEAGEMLSHLAFYVGWPNVFSAIPVAKTVFEGRPAQPASVRP